jgi:hypothetical protein
MKRLSLLLALSFVLLSFGLANAITFEVQLDATSFTHPIFGGTFYPGNTDLKASILMQNDDLAGSVTEPDSLIDWCGWSMSVRMFATQGGVEAPYTVVHNAVGGGLFTPSILTYDGWNKSNDPHYWDLLNNLLTTSFDGNLPDSLNHTTAGGGGSVPDYPGCWIPYGITLDFGPPPAWVSNYPSTSGDYNGDQDLLERISMSFKVPVSGDDTLSICFDQCDWNNPTYDWLFSPPQDFNGPICFPFARVPNLGPEVQGVPTSRTTQHHVDFNETFTLFDNEGDNIVGVGAVDESDNPIGTVSHINGQPGQLQWSFNPPCDWVTDGLSHTVSFYAEDATHTYPNVTFATMSLVVENEPPVISGDGCGAFIQLGSDQTKTATFTATDPNGTADSKNWSVEGVTPAPPAGPYSIVNGVLTFTADALDVGTTFTFTVRVTDCAGEYDECTVEFDVISSLPFVIDIEIEDGNGSKGVSLMDGPGVYLGQHAYVDVIQVEGSEENRGFDFLIAYDNSAIAFMGAYGNPYLFEDVTPDDPDNYYEWEYFTYRFGDNCGGGCPSGLLKVVAIADQNDGAHAPFTFELPPDFTLFTMDFMVSNDYTLECQFVPISFFWMDCGDNSIAMREKTAEPLDVKQAIGKKIFSFAGGDYVDITDPEHTFPSYYGPNATCYCVEDFIVNKFDQEIFGTYVTEHPDEKCPVPFIDFYNGGIKIICSDDIDDRGDINLNGVRWEIADAVVLTNYFIYGLSAFTINEEGQKAASDVNADGIPLSVADLVYLIRIIVGDVLPIDRLSPYAAEASFGHVGDVVTTDAELGAALFVFEGNVEVGLAEGAAHMQVKSDFVNGYTRTLVYSYDKGATFTGNILNTDGQMVSVEAVDYYGSTYKTINLPTSFAVKNYPNPFNPTATIEMALPVATNWTITIYNVAGQKVAGFNGYSEAGVEQVVWDASQQASGIYFYKVQTDTESLTKKMVLLK